MNTLIIFLVCLTLIITGNVATVIIQKTLRRYDGIFHCNLHDPTKDIFTLEMITPFDEIPNKKTILMKVNNVDK